jgi:O-succinylbenzoic acid--CoA ligase
MPSKPLKVVSANDVVSATIALADVLAEKQAVFVSPPEINGVRPVVEGLTETVDEQVGLIVESSGSTGVPKRIELKTESILASAQISLAALGGPGQWLLALPINYIAGLMVLVRSLVGETQPVVMNQAVGFTPEGFARASSLMTGERRYTSLVPTQLNRLAAAAGSDDFVLAQLRRFDAILVGGQAPSRATVELLRELGVKIVETYGMTETCGGCVYDGVPLAGVGVAIMDDGRIAIGGPTIGVPGTSRFVTNDIGEITEDQRLRILGRADRVINSGGIKLALDAVEDWARTQPGVLDAAAIAVSNPEFGDSFVCWVSNVPGSSEIINTDAAIAALGLAARPAFWANIEEIPELSNGKPDLQLLRENFIKFQNDVRERRERGEI